MAQHKTFSVATDVKVYFCDPHSLWQRGKNEKHQPAVAAIPA
jgi:IS30 family transposase